jgi:uncharacterized C2H2 Zn-finger protein
MFWILFQIELCYKDNIFYLYKKMRQLTLNNIVIESREMDNFVNATQMCKAGGKRFGNWIRLDSVKTMIKNLEILLKDEQNNFEEDNTVTHNRVSDTSREIQNNDIKVIDIKSGGNEQGSWIHPDLAVQLAQWVFPAVAFQVSRWVRELCATGSVKIDSKKTDKELIEMVNKLEVKDQIISDMQNQLTLSNSKNLNLIKKIQATSIHKENGYIYLLTCKQYAANDCYKLGRTKDLKKRLTTYQVGRTVDDQMGYVFYYATEQVHELENFLRDILKEYRQAHTKDMYIISWPALYNFVKSACDSFHLNIIPAKNHLIEMNIKSDKVIIPPILSLDGVKIFGEPGIIQNIEVSNETSSCVELSTVIKCNKIHTCEKCNKVFMRRSDLTKHMKNDNCNKIHTCEKCNKVFNTNAQLASHLGRVTPCDAIPVEYKCEKCNKIFPSKYPYDNHMNRKFSCSNKVIF